MRIGILSVRDESYHPNRRIMEAALETGHEAFLIHTRDCLSCIRAQARQVLLPHDKTPHVLLPRIGATINDYAISVVRHFELSGIRVVNGFESILLARNKFMGLQMLAAQGVPVPNSCLVITPKGFERAVDELGGYPVVAKMPTSRQGEGVMLVESEATAAFVMHNLQDNTKGILVQEYLINEGRTDIRAFVLADGLAGAMEMHPRPGDFRSNIHLTGEGKPAELDKALTNLAVQSARTLGLEIAGVDIIIPKDRPPKVIEVNYSPGFRGLEAATGADIAMKIVEHITEAKSRRFSCKSHF